MNIVADKGRGGVAKGERSNVPGQHHIYTTFTSHNINVSGQ